MEGEFIYNGEVAREELYRYLSKEATLKEIISNSKYLVVFPCPTFPPTEKDIKDLEHYFIKREEFEKCAVLRDLQSNLALFDDYLKSFSP